VPMAKEMAEKSNRGGRREGAGRKRSAGRSVTFRVALDVEDHLEENLPASDFLNSLIREHKHLSSMKLPFDVYSFTGSDPVMIPYSLHGLVAGFPIPLDNDEKSQSLDLIRLLGLNKESVFIVRVKGDSMVGSGVDDGDMVIVDRSITDFDGHTLCVCSLNGEFTLKYLRRHEGRYVLVPANPDYPEIPVEDSDRLDIWGVVTLIMKKP